MSKTVDLSLSPTTKQYLVVGGMSCVFLTVLFGGVLTAAGAPFGVALAGAVLGWLAVTALLVRRFGGEDDDSTWAAIPEWQYEGRLAEAGGLTRSEQEQALDELSDEQ